MTEIDTLTLNGINFTGSIPDFFCDFKNLKKLEIMNNPSLTGSIPLCFTKLQNSLEHLNLGENNLNGNINHLCALNKISALYVNTNNLTGNIECLHNLTKINFLNVAHNAFHGSLPAFNANHTSYIFFFLCYIWML